jgi:dihydroflavonol-4-reductase
MIAVTGANGLLGSFIIRRLLAANEKFVAIKRSDSDTHLLDDVASRIQWKDADVLDPVALDEAFDGITHVIHAAAVVSFNPAHEKLIFNVNVYGTRNVVNACLSRDIKKLVHVSSVAALGRRKGQTLIDEDNKWNESSVNSRYAESKYLAEIEVFRGHEEGLDSVVVNPSVILAAADWSRSSAQLFKYVSDERRFYIDSNLNYVDVRDVAEIVFRMLHSTLSGERFIVSAGSLPFIDFFTAVGKRFGKRPPSICLDAGLLRVAAVAETWRSKMLGKEPLLTVETARLAGNHFTYDNQKIKKTLGFEFQPIDSTIDWCCSHYLNFIRKNQV